MDPNKPQDPMMKPVTGMPGQAMPEPTQNVGMPAAGTPQGDVAATGMAGGEGTVMPPQATGPTPAPGDTSSMPSPVVEPEAVKPVEEPVPGMPPKTGGSGGSMPQ